MSIEGKFLTAGVISTITNIGQAELEQLVLNKEIRGHTSHDGAGTTFYISVEAILNYLIDGASGISHAEYMHMQVALKNALAEVQ